MQSRIDLQAVRERAYRLWEERGCPDGRADEDWFAAERQLQAELAADPQSDEAPELPETPKLASTDALGG